MNRQDIRDRILTALNDSLTAPVAFSTDEMDAVIDEASEILAEEAKAIRRTAFVGRRAGATYYFLRGIAPDMMAPYRLWLPDLNRRLVVCSIAQLDAQNEVWPTVNGDPEYWFPVSWDCFGVYPKPAAGGGVLRVDYLAWPHALQDDDEEPEFRQADHDALVMYGIYDGLMKRWDVQRATTLFTKFVEQWATGRARNGVRESQARTYQRSTALGHPFTSGVRRG